MTLANVIPKNVAGRVSRLNNLVHYVTVPIRSPATTVHMTLMCRGFRVSKPPVIECDPSTCHAEMV
jgi:hypothetical protein